MNMFAYVVRRILLIPVTLFGIILINFLVVQVAPGGPVEQLVAKGQLVSLKGGRFGLAEKMNLVVGELSVHPDGFGFVTPETGGKDIYLVAANLKEAWHGDRVVVRIEGSRGRRREGRVIRLRWNPGTYD